MSTDDGCLYVGIDIGKASHFAGFVSAPLLSRHKRFSACPSLSFEQSRQGFERLLQRMQTYAPLERCIVLMEKTGHYHRLLQSYLLEHGVVVYEMQVQERLSRDKSDKRDALGLANHLYNQLELGVQHSDAALNARIFQPPTSSAILLRGLVRYHAELSTSTTRHKNRLIAICDELFPEFTRVIKDPNCVTALRVREKFPTPVEVVGADLAELVSCRTKGRPSKATLATLVPLARSSIGTQDPARIQSLTFEQAHLIKELRLLLSHVDEVEARITAAVATSREGKILTSLGVIGPIQAAAIISAIGTIANFPTVGHLRSYFGWSPTGTQTGTSVDSSTLTHTGNRTVRRMLCLVAWTAIQMDTEWRAIYERLLPVKCSYDERTQDYKGKMKVVGRICGQIIGLIYTLLQRDYEVLRALQPGEEPPEPVLYDRALHHAHRTGSYRRADTVPLALLNSEDAIPHNEYRRKISGRRRRALALVK